MSKQNQQSKKAKKPYVVKDPNASDNGGFPILVRMQNGTEKIIKNAKDLQSVNGQKFTIVKSNFHDYNKPVILPKDVNLDEYQFVSHIHAFLIMDVVPSTANPDLHMEIYLKGIEKPALVGKGWWEKAKTRYTPEKTFLVKTNDSQFRLTDKYYLFKDYVQVPFTKKPSPAPVKEKVVVEEKVQEVVEQKQEDKYRALVGTGALPAMVEIGTNKEVQLGEIVGKAFERSGLSFEDWNALTDEKRDDYIMSTLEIIRGDELEKEIAAESEKTEVTDSAVMEVSDSENPEGKALEESAGEESSTGLADPEEVKSV